MSFVRSQLRLGYVSNDEVAPTMRSIVVAEQ